MLGGSYCVQRCQHGGTSASASKCRGRSELACALVTEQGDITSDACVPNCNTDEECGGGYCDPVFGTCYSTPIVGKPLGAACNPDAPVRECAGWCDVVDNAPAGSGWCVSYCTVGASPVCGIAGTAPGAALCLPFASNGIGDLGYCAPLCDCDADCGVPTVLCLPLAGGNPDPVTGRKGFCTEVVQGATGLPSCT
jgi:hypothetical protein